MIGSTFLKLLPTAHLHLRRDLSLETSKNTYPVVSGRNIFHLFLSESQENRILETFSPDPLIKRFHLDLDFSQQDSITNSPGFPTRLSDVSSRDDVMNDEFHPGKGRGIETTINSVKRKKNWKKKGNLNLVGGFNPFEKY